MGCGVESTSIHTLEHAFKCRTRTLKERQEFILNGNAWRNGGINIFEKLKVGQLRKS